MKLEQSPIQKSMTCSAVNDKANLHAIFWLFAEYAVMIGILIHLYGYSDVSLSALKLGEVADIIVSLIILGVMFRLAWKAVNELRAD